MMPREARIRRRRRRRQARVASVLVALGVLLWPPGLAREVLPGPVPARVLRVLDGDTFEVRARIWLGQDMTVRVRLADIDAPALDGDCARERALAEDARGLAIRLLRPGDPAALAQLADVRYGKYAGRVVARVVAPGGADVAAALLDAGLARPYDGRRRAGWCDAAALDGG